MYTRSHPQNHIISELMQEGRHGVSSQKKTGSCFRTFHEKITRGQWAPAAVLGLNAFFFLVAGCSQQPAQDVLNQINARFEQLEQKLVQLEEQNTRLNESISNGQSGLITMEEKIATLTQQVEKMASRPSSSAVKKPAQPSGVASQGKKQYHTVGRGETLYSIAKKYGLSVDEVRRLNNLNQNQPIQAGQKLVIVPGSQE